MKYVVVSDIHGSLYYTKVLLDIIKKEEPDQIIILGDLYYHGPRNPLPREYNPMEVAKILNTLKEQLIVIRGNCDAVVDEMISEFSFVDHYNIIINNKKVMFTHGHLYNKEYIPDDIDVLIYGHFHTGFIERVNKVLCVNAGSITLPKNNTANSLLIIDCNLIKLIDLAGNTIDRYKL